MWNKIADFLGKYLDKFCDFTDTVNDKLNKDKYGKQKKLYLTIIFWYILGCITFQAHPTFFLFIGLSIAIYQQLFNKPKL